MGTTRSGRYFHTKGAKNIAGNYAIVHSNEGDFTKPKKGQHIRLKGGGHGQDGIDLLDKYGIKYNIVKTYPNGVRVGNVPRHKNKAKAIGEGQAWFPRK